MVFVSCVAHRIIIRDHDAETWTVAKNIFDSNLLETLINGFVEIQL